MRYVVNRHMEGDRAYVPGEERELDDIDAAPLLASGAITPVAAKPAKGKSK